MLSSINDFEEHHKWKVIMCVLGSSLTLPSNLGISDGSFVGIGGEAGECRIISFINFDRSDKFKVARNEILGGGTAFQFYWKLYGLDPPPIYIISLDFVPRNERLRLCLLIRTIVWVASKHMSS